MTDLATRFKDTYGRLVIENPAMQNRLMGIYKFALRQRAKARAVTGIARRRGGLPTNIYYASTQKTGSHWIKAIFDDPRIRRYTKLWSYPGHRYEWDQFHKRFPPYHFVPGLFISYGQYEEVIKPANHRTFYIMRDPRDLIVSWYYSMRDVHRLTGKVAKHRAILRTASFEDGITYCIETLAFPFAFMRTWAIEGPRDPAVILMRFENLVADPNAGFRRIMDHCCIPIPTGELDVILKDYTKDKMRQLDEDDRSFLRKRSLSEGSHYRHEASSWREAFTPAHTDLFSRVNGDLLACLGYADGSQREPAQPLESERSI